MKIHELKTEKSLCQCCTYLFLGVEPSDTFASVVTDRQTRMWPTDYCNPRCACAPRFKKSQWSQTYMYQPSLGSSCVGYSSSATNTPCLLYPTDKDNMIYDSGKMAVLDKLLAQLKMEGHRVLVYSQMTRMIDLLEEFMAYRRYKFIRLDGSSRISDRRDMVDDFQTK